MKRTGYPKGRKGYVVDHIVPLECGGADVPSNMQWQTVQEAKIKDRTERSCGVVGGNDGPTEQYGYDQTRAATH